MRRSFGVMSCWTAGVQVQQVSHQLGSSNQESERWITYVMQARTATGNARDKTGERL